jgi:hypothetical protein
MAVAVGSVLSVFAVTGQASEPAKGQVPASTLASVGLGSMQLMSEEQGAEVRGKFVLNPEGATVTGIITNIQNSDADPAIKSALIAFVNLGVATLNNRAVTPSTISWRGLS